MAESAEEIRHHIQNYIKVGAVLFVMTVVTVAVSYLHIDSVTLTVLIALVIASFKGLLVAAIFMHLSAEKAIIYWVLFLTVIFFVFLMVVPISTDIESVFQ